MLLLALHHVRKTRRNNLPLKARSIALVLVSLIGVASAQQSQGANDTQTPLNPIHSNHVVVIMEENRDAHLAQEYMPYLRSLAQQYAQGLQVYSDSHGSWLAYGELTSGLSPHNGEGDNNLCNGDGCSQIINIDNLVRHFAAQGKTWKGYFQGMPQVGFMGYQYGSYVRRHNPFPFYSDVAYHLPMQWNMVPADPFLLQDIQNDHLANFIWISPDLFHDAHNGFDDQQALEAADQYLQILLPHLLATPEFQPGGDGVLLVTFDEGELGDRRCGTNPDPYDCGGNIWHVLIGPQVKRNYQSNTHYFQGSQLRMFCDLLGLTSCPGDGATSPDMSEFFQ